MAPKKNGLGRGLGSLLADNSIEGNNSIQPVKLDIMDIEPNKEQARKQFDEAALSELADSIAQHGVLQPLLVRPIIGGGYQLIAGERRWRASRIAGLTQVPVIIKELTDDEAAVISLIENLQREDLNPIEEAWLPADGADEKSVAAAGPDGACKRRYGRRDAFLRLYAGNVLVGLCADGRAGRGGRGCRFVYPRRAAVSVVPKERHPRQTPARAPGMSRQSASAAAPNSGAAAGDFRFFTKKHCKTREV